MGQNLRSNGGGLPLEELGSTPIFKDPETPPVRRAEETEVESVRGRLGVESGPVEERLPPDDFTDVCYEYEHVNGFYQTRNRLTKCSSEGSGIRGVGAGGSTIGV